jgi:hypothetical protein
MKRNTHHLDTKAVRGGVDLEKKNGPLATPIFQTSTFEVTDNEEQLRVTPTDHFYTRYGNPTNTVAEKRIAELEGVDAALTFYVRRGRHHHDNPGLAEGGRSHRGSARYLRRSDKILHAMAAQAEYRDHVRRYHVL